MKKLILMFIMMTLFAVGCTTFNRSALWNSHLSGNYCTYWSGDITNGTIMAHIDDDWTQKRLELGYELKVKRVLGSNIFLLDRGWETLRDPYEAVDTDLKWNKFEKRYEPLGHHPIVVQTISNHSLKTGDFFKVYGQYKYVGEIKIEDVSDTCHFFKQINSKQEYTFEEPFIDWNL